MSGSARGNRRLRPLAQDELSLALRRSDRRCGRLSAAPRSAGRGAEHQPEGQSRRADARIAIERVNDVTTVHEPSLATACRRPDATL